MRNVLYVKTKNLNVEYFTQKPIMVIKGNLISFYLI